MPVKFNVIMHLPLAKKKTSVGKEIYHFSGASLRFNVDNSFCRLWMSYFIRTPFFDADSMGRLYEGFLKIRSDAKNAGLKLSAIVAGKNRAFFVEPTKIDSMKKTFSIRNDETIIPAENENSIQKLIDAMKITRGKYVFFIMTEKFLNKNFPFDLLTKEGFVENVDFVKGWQYLDSPLNSYPLICAM